MKHTSSQFLLMMFLAVTATGAGDVPRREAPYSVVYYGLTSDEAQARRQLQTVRDLGCTGVHTLVYWWQAETLGGDYWKKDYSPDLIGENYDRAIDHFVNISRELGMRPSLRLGSFREFDGKFHPMDDSGTPDQYAKWVTKLATRYRGKIDHYVIGDEENHDGPGGFDGSANAYMQKMLVPLATAIRKGDPAARISICGTSSAPATRWVLELIDLGLPEYADGVACNFWHHQMQEPVEIEDFMKRVRAKWPAAKFYANGVGYAPNRNLHDLTQAAIVAQSMFRLFDLGWDSAPYYLYTFCTTVDTRQNYGLCSVPSATDAGSFSDAWKAYQTIAHTFYDRSTMKRLDNAARLVPMDRVQLVDGAPLSLTPPAPLFRVYESGDGRLLIYLAYPDAAFPQTGRWRIRVDRRWHEPALIEALDYRRRTPLTSKVVESMLEIEDVTVCEMPTIIELKDRAR